jgi:lactate dehydrogenase-like 2-hydroxyacid dehydrogenase
LAVANRLKAFEPNKIMYHNRNRNSDADNAGLDFVDLDCLLKESDFLICTCASTKETERIFDKKIFEKMKPTSVSRSNYSNIKIM